MSQENIINTTGELSSWNGWCMVQYSNLPLPWAKSMVCAIRLSKKLLGELTIYVEKNKDAYKFIEHIFHTICLHKGLKVRVVNNLSGIVWRRNWIKEELNASTMYHPVKSLDKQIEFRDYLLNRI